MYLYMWTSEGNRKYAQKLINGTRIRNEEKRTENGNWLERRIKTEKIENFNNFELTILKEQKVRSIFSRLESSRMCSWTLARSYLILP